MLTGDDFTEYHQDVLSGRYDCTDRIVINGYFPLGQQGGGFLAWWRSLTGSDATLDQNHLLRMAGDFSRRVHTYAQQKKIPLMHCEPGVRKHELAERHIPDDPSFQGLFLILVAKSPALAWKVTRTEKGVPHLEPKWPFVNHYHFHIMDREWGHITIKMSGHPPFSMQVMLNGHEWVERQARKQTISSMKEGNCFVGGSDFMALSRIADTLRHSDAIGQFAGVCDRWAYTTCLCFALDTEEQARSGFRYRYSCYQIEYSRNLLFKSGAILDQVFQGLIDRTRRLLDVPTLKTIFGRKRLRRERKKFPRMERVLDESEHDLTVFKVHFGKLTLKMYDKGDRVLRIEAIAHNVKDLRCGRVLEKLSDMLAKLKHMVSDFLNVLCAAHLSYLDSGVLDSLGQPTHRGAKRLAGIDLQKDRIRMVCTAALALAPKPGGFSIRDLARKTGELIGTADYTPRQASYDLNKLRGKSLVISTENPRLYRLSDYGVRALAGLIILREKVIKPVLAGIIKDTAEHPPKNIHPLDARYDALCREMRILLGELNLIPA